LGDKFDRELIKYAIRKYAIDKNVDLKRKIDSGWLYLYLKDKFDEGLIKYAINENTNLEIICRFLKNKFDKELIRYAINKKADLENLYFYLGYKFDDELKQLYKEAVNG